MSRPAAVRTLAFLVSLAVGGLVVAVLLATEVAEAWAIVAGWLAFFATGWALAQLS